MLNFSKWKITLILSVCFLAMFFALPNFFTKETISKLHFFSNKKVNLGLDLKGGSSLLLEVDFNAYLRDKLENLRSEIKSVLRVEKIDGERILYRGGISILNNVLRLNLINKKIDNKKVISLIKKIDKGLEIKLQGEQLLVFYNKKSVKDMKENIISQSIEIVRRRVDETGMREPDIQRQGDIRVLLQVPGLKDPAHLKELLGKTAKLTFHLLDESRPYPDNDLEVILPYTSKRLPSDKGNNHYTILKKVIIDGTMLSNASVGFSNTSQPVVNIRFNPLGAKKFADVTKSNIGKPFAIILDNKVITAPVIRSAILSGSAEITGSFTVQEASDMALLLRAGSLPAPLNILEERTIGPSLGADSVNAGKIAVIFSMALVALVMTILYGVFGIFSNIALIFNIIIIVAVLTIFEATLTLPGIAGIVLTMGMAVDANVLIFERIYEETKIGRTAFSAIDSGFRQAFKTILDSNITTLAVALILFSFGSGPIKGFAITLSVGIISSMFSAILLTRLMVSIWLKRTTVTILDL